METKSKKRKRIRLDFSKTKSMTIKEHAQGLDVNDIVKRYGVNGPYPTSTRVPQYLDVSKKLSVFDALNLKVQIDQYFGALPSAIRERFKNDSLSFAQFVSDPRNNEELVKMKIIKAPEQPAPKPAAKAAPQPAPAEKGEAGPPTKEVKP